MWHDTPWNIAARQEHTGVLEKLLDWAKELQLKPEELRNEVFLSKDEDNKMVWHMAARQGNVEVLEKL